MICLSRQNLLALMFLLMSGMRSYTLKSLVRYSRLKLSRMASSTPAADSGCRRWKDKLVTGLNGAQDMSVKVISCTNVVQEIMDRNQALSPIAGKVLGDVVACTLMMGAGLKGEETLQVNLVGTSEGGLKNVVAISDGNLHVRGMVGNPQFQLPDSDPLSVAALLGDGQVQIVKSHPSWKHPMNGVTELRNAPVAVNLALYMAESEQRPTAMLTEVLMDGRRCVAALGAMVETLPGATEEHIELGVANLNRIQQKGLFSYFQEYEGAKEPLVAQGVDGFTPTAEHIQGIHGGDLTTDQRERAEELFESLDSPLDKILDDCLTGMDTGSIRWDRKPKFKCTCGVERVWKALRLLPRDEVQSMVDAREPVEMKCQFCGTQYSVTADEVRDTILCGSPAPP